MSFNAKLYPNPVEDILNIDLLPNSMSYEILDITGQIIQERNSLPRAVMSDLPKGIYLIRFTNGSEVISTKRIVKN